MSIDGLQLNYSDNSAYADCSLVAYTMETETWSIAASFTQAEFTMKVSEILREKSCLTIKYCLSIDESARQLYSRKRIYCALSCCQHSLQAAAKPDTKHTICNLDFRAFL